MKITLKNFRCYENSCFDFGDQGLTLLSGSSGSGKCMGKDTNILMYDGTIKKIQDIKTGELIMGDDSTSRTVLSTCNGKDMLYQIIPSKGKPYIVNSKHILTLKGDKPSYTYIKDIGKWRVTYMENSKLKSSDFDNQNNAFNFYQSLDTNPVNDICIEDYLKLGEENQSHNYTFHVAVNFEEKTIDVDPYLIGVWFGGGINKNSNANINVINRISKILQTSSDTLLKFDETIISSGIGDSKHIPYEYKTNSRENRLKLLAGIIDISKNVCNNTIKIVQKTKQVAYDIQYIALSLGFMAETICTKYNYQILISGNNLDTIPTYKKLYKRKQSKSVTEHKFKVNQLGLGEYYGFELDGNGRYLMGDFKVTHNTSILLGIYFALFGTGNKLAMYGKTSCTVVLEVDGMTITRTKRPNRLVVKTDDNEYEDEAGQFIINKKYGESFKTTGYISQNARDSFILMSPIEKLAFLESFAFNDINLSQIKKRCKDLIKERNETLLKTTSQLEMASLMIKEMEKPVKVPFPLKCSKKNREKSIKNEIIRNKNAVIRIKKLRKNIKKLENELHSLQVLNAKIQSKQESLESVIEKLADLSLEKDNSSYVGDDKLNEYENQLSIIISQRELISLQDRYDEDVIRLQNMKEEESNNNIAKITSIEDKLWKEYSIEECDTTIREYKQIVKDLEKLNDLRNNLTNYKVDENQLSTFVQELKEAKNTLEVKRKLLDKLDMQQEIFKCPSCETPLRFNENELHIHEDEHYNENELADISKDISNVEEEIVNLKRKITSLETTIPIKQNKLARYKEILLSISDIEDQYEEIPSIDEMKSELEYIRSYKSSQEELTRQLNKLKELKEMNKYSSTITSFEKSIARQSEKIQKIQKMKEETNSDNTYNEEEIRSKIIKQKQNKEKLVSIGNDIKQFKIQQSTCEHQLDSIKSRHIEKYKVIKDETELKSDISEKMSELSNLITTQNEHQTNVDNIEKYQEYVKAKENYDTWSQKIKTLQQEELECRKLYASVTLLREKILEAESIAMLNIISSINTHSQSYLDAFFPDNPISVKLVPFKESKSGAKKGTKKPQINLEIEYKGMEADINMLSGGELSRVVLAYALALGEMFNTPLMLLDECTSSLDQDLTNIVMDGIRENFTDKLVVIIAHQTVKGVFDKVVEI